MKLPTADDFYYTKDAIRRLQHILSELLYKDSFTFINRPNYDTSLECITTKKRYNAVICADGDEYASFDVDFNGDYDKFKKIYYDCILAASFEYSDNQRYIKDIDDYDDDYDDVGLPNNRVVYRNNEYYITDDIYLEDFYIGYDLDLKVKTNTPEKFVADLYFSPLVYCPQQVFLGYNTDSDLTFKNINLLDLKLLDKIYKNVLKRYLLIK